MIATNVMFYLLLLCGTVLCADGLSDMERKILQTHGASTTAGTAKPLLKGCDLGSKEGSNGRPGACVRETQCRGREKKGRPETTTDDPAIGFVPRDTDSATTLPFDVEEIDPDNSGCTGFAEVCCVLSNVMLQLPKPRALANLGCGFSNSGANSFRGIPDLAGYAEFAEFPWMVALMKNGGGSGSPYLGGGTIIHPSVVMTVAHKVEYFTPSQLSCHSGKLNLTVNNEVYKYQERSVSNIIIHPEYKRNTAEYDVALLLLSSPFDLKDAPHMGVACLEPQMPSTGTMCYSMGWGKDFDGKPQSEVLKKITVPLVAHNRCEELLQKKVLSTLSLHHTLICAGGEEDVDTCTGDGGSSLVCPIKDGDKNRYSVVGMVAYGISTVCGKKDEPAFYVKVPAVYDWIVNEISHMNLKASTFVY